MNKKLIQYIDGPNLNMLGVREPEIYGSMSLEEIHNSVKDHIKIKQFDVDVSFFQSNAEGDIVDRIQQSNSTCSGLIINAAGFSHTSVAILDALLAVKKPTIEEVAEVLGEPANKIKYTIRANKHSISYDNEDNEKATAIKNKIPDTSYFSNPEENLEKKELMSIIKKNLRLLTAKEEKIIRLRFGIEENENNTKDFPITDDMKAYFKNEK